MLNAKLISLTRASARALGSQCRCKATRSSKAGLSEKANISPQQLKKIRGCNDFILGLSVRNRRTGYALLQFADLQPLQFGVIDLQKTEEVQQRALEIAAVLRDLRERAPQKLQRMADDAEPIAGKAKKDWRWVVCVDDSTVDRSPPINRRESTAQRAIAMLQGLVIGDCKRIFKVAPLLVHPRRSRQLFGVRSLGPVARKELLEIAIAKVPDFPVVKSKNDKVVEETLLMADAWASARYSQRTTLVAELRADTQLVSQLREQVLASKKLSRLNEAVEELYPRSAGRELAKVFQSRVEGFITKRIHQILDADLEPASADDTAGGAEAAADTRGSAGQAVRGRPHPASL